MGVITWIPGIGCQFFCRSRRMSRSNGMQNGKAAQLVASYEKFKNFTPQRAKKKKRLHLKLCQAMMRLHILSPF